MTKAEIILLILLTVPVNVNYRLYKHIRESQEARKQLLIENIELLKKELACTPS